MLAILTPCMIHSVSISSAVLARLAIDTLSRRWSGPSVMVFVIIRLLNMRLCLQVIIEDYIHHKAGIWH